MPKKYYTNITKANDEVKRGRARIARLRKEVKAAPLADALGNFAAIQAGAITYGAVNAMTGDVFGDKLPVGPTGGGMLAMAGYFMDSPFMIYAAAGFLAPYISEMTEEMLEKK